MLDNIALGSYAGSLITFVVALFIWICFRKYSGKTYINLPPGPPPYPIIGNILDIGRKDLGDYFDECRRKYGDVFCLRIFRKVIIVFNGYDVIKEAFVQNSHLFSERHAIPIFSEYDVNALIVGTGEMWKRNRRFTLQTLRDFGMGKNMIQVKIHEEIQEVVHEIEKYNGQPFDIKFLLNGAIANIILSIICGRRYSYDSAPILDHLQRIQKVMALTHLFFLPTFCKCIPFDPLGVKNVLELTRENLKFYSSFIDEHLESYDDNVTRDLIDAYIKRTRSKDSLEKNESENRKELRSIIADLFSAGSETSATALKWGIVYLLRDREMQTKLYEELKSNVPDNRLPGVEDKLKLPNLEATVLEILRLGNIVPFAVPHAPIQDCTFRGYTIPQEATILPNLQSVLYDKSTWKNPELFQPCRFITSEGKSHQNKEFIPFSTGYGKCSFKAGRRSCIGESLARMELFLFFSAMVQRFEFLPPDGEQPPSLDAALGVTRAPKPFMMRAIKRKQ